MTEYVAVSNTGKTITVSLSREFYDRWADVVPLDDKGRPHVDIEFDAFGGIIKITPGTTGRRVGRHTSGNGGAYVGCHSDIFPEWPAHGKLVFTSPPFDEKGVIILVLPDEGLPAPEPRKTSTNNAHDSRTDYSHAGPAKARAFPPMPVQKPEQFKVHPRWANAGPFDLPPAEQAPAPAPGIIKDATRNLLIELEGQSFTFMVPLRLRLKILSLLQADPNVKGDAPIGFD
jgi:hypothetical protein